MRLRRGWLLPVGTVALAIAGWQLLTVTGVFSPQQFPTAAATFAALGRIAGTAEFWASVGATLLAWSLGVVIASAMAVVIGCALAFSDFAARSAAGVIEVFKAIPAIAVLPLVILVLGSTLAMKVFLIVFAVFWPLVIQVVYGVRSIDPVALDTARSLGIRGVRRFLTVVLPGASSYVATGLRIASASALILAVVSEMVGGAAGIGRSILLAQNGGVSGYPVMYAYIVTAGMLGLAVTGGFLWLERAVLHWHASYRRTRLDGRRTR